MKTLASILFLLAFLSPMSFGQADDKEERPAPVPISVPQATAEKLLIHRVEPVWKHYDMEARVLGTVVLRVTISKAGFVKNIRIISGPAMLQKAAIDAVRQWRYKPYTVHGRPIEFTTRVLVTLSNY